MEIGALIEILESVRDLLTPPGNWIKDEFARDHAGNALGHGDSGDAVCWCLRGAIQKIAPENAALEVEGFLKKSLCEPHIEHFNDAPATTHPMVLAALDKAVSEARAALSEAR